MRRNPTLPTIKEKEPVNINFLKGKETVRRLENKVNGQDE
jgi:hypothetical protein